MSVVDFIVESAKIPSFSTFEERLHPYILDVLSEINGVNIVKIKDNNIVVFWRGEKAGKPVVITSHLDKINHYGEDHPEELTVEVINGQIFGQMDDTAGIGICLNLLKKAQSKPILINTARGGLLKDTEVEEALSTGLIAGFGADVLEIGTPPPDYSLLIRDDVIVTPHSASLTRTTYSEMCVLTVQNTLDLLAGRKIDARYIFNSANL